MSDIAGYKDMQFDAADKIVSDYAHLVKKIAHHLLAKLPANILLDDLIQSGMIGLLEAAKNYDPTKGASFETYAGIRIRGTMLDEVRKGDWIPRSVHRNSRMISEAVRTVENTKGRDARDLEVAKELGIALQEYHSMLQDCNGCHLAGFSDSDASDGGHPDNNNVGPLEGLQKENFKQLLAESVSSLPEREKLILALYYDEELNLKEIGEVLGVSESRVCQIHSQAMIRLQVRVGDKL